MVHRKPATQPAIVHPRLVGNWGVAIILLTFIVRGAMYPLTKAQYTSMAKMRMLQLSCKQCVSVWAMTASA